MTPQHPAAPETEGMCPVCRLVREEPDEPIEPGDYYTVDPTSPSRCPSCGMVPSRNSEGAQRVAMQRWLWEHRAAVSPDAVLASDWLAAHDDRVRREEGERIAQAIEAERDAHGYSTNRPGLDRAASIARAASVGRGEGL